MDITRERVFIYKPIPGLIMHNMTENELTYRRKIYDLEGKEMTNWYVVIERNTGLIPC